MAEDQWLWDLDRIDEWRKLILSVTVWEAMERPVSYRKILKHKMGY